MKFQKLLQETSVQKLCATPQVVRPSQAGACLPRGFPPPPPPLPFEKELGASVPILLGPINALSSGMQSEGAGLLGEVGLGLGNSRRAWPWVLGLFYVKLLIDHPLNPFNTSSIELLKS